MCTGHFLYGRLKPKILYANGPLWAVSSSGGDCNQNFFFLYFTFLSPLHLMCGSESVLAFNTGEIVIVHITWLHEHHILTCKKLQICHYFWTKLPFIIVLFGHFTDHLKCRDYGVRRPNFVRTFCRTLECGGKVPALNIHSDEDVRKWGGRGMEVELGEGDMKPAKYGRSGEGQVGGERERRSRRTIGLRGC